MNHRICGLLMVMFVLVGQVFAADDILVADFEGTDFGGWATNGTAFGSGPVDGSQPYNRPPTGFMGKKLVSNMLNGGIGTLTSPEFTIQRDFINFLIGGSTGDVGVELLVGSNVVRSVQGQQNDVHMEWATWGVKEFNGKPACIRIIDKTWTGAAIIVDQIVQSDINNATAVPRFQREMALKERYLNLPVKTGAAKRFMTISVDGRKVHAFDIELADGAENADFQAFLDVSAWKGKTARLHLNKVDGSEAGLNAIDQSDEIKGADTLYKEKLRPQFHYTQKRGWNNDPNGMVYYKGEWHLFYQHNPVGWKWGNMYWGHAVSKDLVHWEELSEALYPYVMARAQCWSGSAVIDHYNTSGFQIGREKVMVAAFTDTGAGEAIAYSGDRGRTWTYWTNNPVVAHSGRDPKVFWYTPPAGSEVSGEEKNLKPETPNPQSAIRNLKSSHGWWVMAVYEQAGGDGISIYNSPDLKKWKLQSTVRKPGFLECPELFELPVDHDKKNTRWVAFGGDAKYVLGSFDGKTFTPEDITKQQVHFGTYYASQTFNDAPDGRRIQIGWAPIAMPGMPFNQMISFPCELTLRTTEEGVRLFVQPVREIEALHGTKHSQKNVSIKAGALREVPVAGRLLDIRAEFEVGGAKSFGLTVFGRRIGYDTAGQKLDNTPLKAEKGKIRLQLLVDRASLEVFGNDGRVCITSPLGTDDKAPQVVRVWTEGGDTKLNKLEIYELKSIWN